jgi:hypothetical protein
MDMETREDNSKESVINDKQCLKNDKSLMQEYIKLANL